VAGLNLKILQIIIDRYVVEGKDFGPYCTSEDLKHVWVTPLSPGSPIHNLIFIGDTALLAPANAVIQPKKNL
jgi:hypothetical protein